MTRIHLIRHGSNDYVAAGKLAGRLPDVHLNETGRSQAEALAARLAAEPFEAIYTSPLPRALQTVLPLADRLGLTIEVDEDLNEVAFGEWSGRSVAELKDDEEWNRYNAYRSGSRAPGGESLLDVQTRMVRALERIRASHPAGVVAVASHGDPIRSWLLWLLGMPLDHISRIEVDLAMDVVVELADWGGRLIEMRKFQP